MLLSYLPLILALSLCLVAIGGSVHDRTDRVLTNVALAIFGTYVGNTQRHRQRRIEALNGAHFSTTYRVYAARTLLVSAIVAVAGSVIGIYVLAGILRALAISPETMTAVLPQQLWFLADLLVVPDVTVSELFALLLVSGATFGMLGWVGTYYVRWWIPVNVAATRRRRTEATMIRTIAFIYALSRSGMAFPDVMAVLSENRGVYGDAAQEVNAAVNDMHLLGVDVITAISEMAKRTPSEGFEEFSENLASVLRSGRNLSDFLHDQYEHHWDEAEARQEQLLDLLANLAEVYVTLIVAGPLFLITILVVIGLATGGTLSSLWLLAYVVLPLANLAFIIYLSTITETLRTNRELPRVRQPLGGVANVRRITERRRATLETDGGVRTIDRNVERLLCYQRLEGVLYHLSKPIQSVLERPERLLYVTVPLVLVVTAIRLPGAVIDGSIDVRILDDILIQAVLFVVGTYAIVREIHSRRMRRLEAVIPDFLDRLSSINEAGMTVVESLGRVRSTELGEFDSEVDRLWRDIEWGADIDSALYRLEQRVQTPAVTRMVTLITNATAASGDLAPVLRIAADQAQTDRRLERQRNQVMFTYLVVIYLSFFVFLVIIAALNSVLIPSLPETLPAAETGPAMPGAVGQAGMIDKDAYTLVFFHTALIQGSFSGFVAGQMSGESFRDGAKHAAILLAIAYGAFLVML